MVSVSFCALKHQCSRSIRTSHGSDKLIIWEFLGIFSSHMQLKFQPISHQLSVTSQLLTHAFSTVTPSVKIFIIYQLSVLVEFLTLLSAQYFVIVICNEYDSIKSVLVIYFYLHFLSFVIVNAVKKAKPSVTHNAITLDRWLNIKIANCYYCFYWDQVSTSANISFIYPKLLHLEVEKFCLT